MEFDQSSELYYLVYRHLEPETTFHTIEKEAYSPNGSRTGHNEQHIEYRMNHCLDEQPQTPTWTSIRFKNQEIPECQLLKAVYIPGEIKTHLIKKKPHPNS